MACAGQHRSFGVHISFVRSVELDNWTEKQVCLMRAGGNQRLAEFFQEHQQEGITDLRTKYSSLAADRYRHLLQVEVAKELGLPEPTFQQQQQPQGGLSANLRQYQSASSISSTDVFGGRRYSSHNDLGHATSSSSSSCCSVLCCCLY
ncbi:putative ARF1-directed GTPase-activating protein, variant 2 [Balamuthia mandrillaris]